MTKISLRDAAKFHELSTVADTTRDMVVIGIYSMPPSTGGQTVTTDQSPKGQEIMRLQQIIVPAAKLP